MEKKKIIHSWLNGSNYYEIIDADKEGYDILRDGEIIWKLREHSASYKYSKITDAEANYIMMKIFKDAILIMSNVIYKEKK